ncbi:hypothetical protein, partial [Pseudomonas helleri]|uniref:hypothetical protein n=1 Tax=Pseudomonas helleri TaxID=1608996 RepID=UPI003FD2FF81
SLKRVQPVKSRGRCTAIQACTRCLGVGLFTSNVVYTSSLPVQHTQLGSEFQVEFSSLFKPASELQA